jgi:acetyl-CoA synthetase
VLDRRGDGFAAHATVLSYAALAARSSRFAHLLGALVVSAGGRVFSLAGRGVALFSAALGSWKAHVVFASLFLAFGPEPRSTRLAQGGAQVLVSTPSLGVGSEEQGAFRNQGPGNAGAALA